MRAKARQSSKRLLQEILNGCKDARGIQAVLSKNLKCWSGLAIGVLNTDNLNGNRCALGKSLANRAAQTADYGVFLNSHNLAGLCCRSGNQLSIQRLNGVNVDNLGVDTLCC